MASPRKPQAYTLKIYNGRVTVLIDGYIFFAFNQLDFKGLYAYKDDSSLYGLDVYLKDTKLEIYFKNRDNWLRTLKLLDQHL